MGRAAKDHALNTIISDSQAKYRPTINVPQAPAVAPITNVTFTVSDDGDP